MAYTGGELNELNGKMGISNPNTSVPVMKLIKQHNPKSKEALVQLIEYHYKNKCDCGVISKGTVTDFGEKLYHSQKKYWGEYRYSLKECIQWEYDLFVVQSLKGGLIEKKAITLLQNKLPNNEIKEAEGYLDEELRVDVIIYDKTKNIIGGVQVKPKTFNQMRKEVLYMQRKQNLKWIYPVWFLFYNRDESFDNFDSLIEEIKAV